MKRIFFFTMLTIALGGCLSVDVPEPYGTIKNQPFYGANQIIAASTSKDFFDKLLNNMKQLGYGFNEIDRTNGFISPKPKVHPRYSNTTMFIKLSYIKEDSINKFIVTADYYGEPIGDLPEQKGSVVWNKGAKSYSRVVWDEMMRLFDGIPGVTFVYRRL